MPELEVALRELGRDVAFPATPDLATTVGRRLRDEPAVRLRRLRLPRPLAIALAVVALALAVALAVPPARSALLRFFGIRGATIERVERRPTFDMTTNRRLGIPVTLDQARTLVPFEILVPQAGGLDVVTYDANIPAVTFSSSERRLLLTEFRGETTPYVQKAAGPGTRIEPVDVNRGAGFWLAGDRHRFVFADASGRVLESRAAGNVLLWEQGELTLRLEGARTKAEALRIAGTLRRRGA
jgi:hypothetical protein